MGEIVNGIYPEGDDPIVAFIRESFVYFVNENKYKFVVSPSLFCKTLKLNRILSTDWERTANDEELFMEIFPWSGQRNLEKIEKLIMEGANVNCIEESGNNPLHLVYNPVIAVLLIKHGAHVDAVGLSGFTPLHIAAQQFDPLDMIPMLLFYNADTSICEQRGNTPLMYLMKRPNRYRGLSGKIALLLQYECDFSYINEAGSSLLTLAMISERECFVDAIIKRGGNFSTLSGDFQVLMWCIDQNDPDEFRWFWNIFHYKDTWFFKQPILYHLLKNDKYEAFDYVIESPKLQDVFAVWFGDHEYKQGTLLYKMECQQEEFSLVHILNATTRNYNYERAEKAIYTLLSNGCEPTEHEVIEIYKVFGYGELFKLCLNLDVSGSGSPYNFTSLIPKILLNPHSSSQEIINECTLNISKLRTESVMETMSHITSHKFSEMLRNSQQKMLRQLSTRRIPTLVELSRNQSLLGVSKKFKVKNSCDFHNLLKKISLPNLLRNLILFKSPIYRRKSNEE